MATLRAVVLALCVLALLLVIPASAAQTCAVADDPLTTTPPDWTDASVIQCVAARCSTTLGINITTATGGYCNGDATTEASVACATLLTAYQSYYSCILATVEQSGVGDMSLIAELELYDYTPGLPLHMTNISCYACNNFRNTVVPALGASFTCTWSCEDAAPLGVSRITSNEPGKGYNHVLCGIGCMTCLLMGMAFTLFSMFIFLCCGCCWPTPSLKTTVAAAAEANKEPVESDDEEHEEQEEDENRDRAADDVNVDEDEAQPNNAAAAPAQEASPAAERDVNNWRADDDDDDEEL